MKEVIMAKCGQECEIYSRVCGYFSAVNRNWNKGKVSEWNDRKPFVLEKIREQKEKAA